MTNCYKCKYKGGWPCNHNAYKAWIILVREHYNEDGFSKPICLKMGKDIESYYFYMKSIGCNFFSQADRVGFIDRFICGENYIYSECVEPYLYTIFLKWDCNLEQWLIIKTIKNYNINIEYLNPNIEFPIGKYFRPDSYSSTDRLYLTNNDIPIELNCTESTKTKVTRPIPEILEELDEAVDSREDICTQTQEN